MKVLLKRDEVRYIYTYLYSLPLDIKYHKIFNYFVELNLKRLKDDFICIQSLINSCEPTEEYSKFLNEKKYIEDNYFTTDGNGNYIIIEGKKDEYIERFNKLIEDYKDCTIEHDAYSAEIGNFLSDKIEVDIEPIPFKYFPESMPRELYQVLLYLRKETDEEILEKK